MSRLKLLFASAASALTGAAFGVRWEKDAKSRFPAKSGVIDILPSSDSDGTFSPGDFLPSADVDPLASVRDFLPSANNKDLLTFAGDFLTSADSRLLPSVNASTIAYPPSQPAVSTFGGGDSSLAVSK